MLDSGFRRNDEGLLARTFSTRSKTAEHQEKSMLAFSSWLWENAHDIRETRHFGRV
jgi:hypothetical protein